MRTIYVILAEKQYSSSKVIAAFDTQEGADNLKEVIEGVEPRFTLSVQRIELHSEGVNSYLSRVSVPKPNPPGGLISGTPLAADPPEAFISENPDGPGAA